MNTQITKKERRNGFLVSSLQEPLLDQLLEAKQLYLYSAVQLVSKGMGKDAGRYLNALRPASEHDSVDVLLDSLECLLEFPSNAQLYKTTKKESFNTPTPRVQPSPIDSLAKKHAFIRFNKPPSLFNNAFSLRNPSSQPLLLSLTALKRSPSQIHFPMLASR
ncbi:hypothetical protein DSO57_1022779 [Entomophthora muscae]|uniref:Uncharacterized protein n=2 Tax=Entomophthora muscae TaxID=34485 RepID=A0ACC2RST6_9FUNG|nr:hypothetical protein DSO57_1027690 [Entomophthora muscae]KAJ9080640.1 hypothetical protein DSO57_1022779 [Entomophthora muscae]